MPFPIYSSQTGYTCSPEGSYVGATESPNSDPDDDVELSVLSHEMNEALTDPFGSAWFDGSGNEVADDCAYIYGNTATFGGSAGSYFDQTINGDHYFIQEEFSNDDYVAATSGCADQLGTPDAPTGVVGAAGNAEVTVSWSAPADDGGATISGYTVTASPGGATCSWTVGPLSCTVAGLTNGTPYTFVVTATNNAGTSVPSTASGPVTPATVPDAPTGVVGAAGNAQVTVSWSAPADDGGATISGYTVTASPGGATCSWTVGPLSCTVAGLTNGTPYTFVVTATNNAGTSVPSTASGPVTPATSPDAPARASAVGGDTQASVTWSAPPNDGGATITVYTVTASPSGQTCSWVSGPLTCTVTGLANGTDESFSVTATNGEGTGPGSLVSNRVTPEPWAGDLNPVTPARILDTRNGTGAPQAPLGEGNPLTLQVTGRGGVPASGVSAVVMNVTAVQGTSPSYLTVWPADVSQPLASNLNFAPGEDIPNLVTVGLSPSGQVKIYNHLGSVDVVADVVGWYGDGTATTGRGSNR